MLRKKNTLMVLNAVLQGKTDIRGGNTPVRGPPMIRRQFLGLLFVFLFIAPAWSVMFAQAQGGSITTFSTGNAEETVTVAGGQHSSVGFDLQRNTTITSATFFIKPTTSGASPGTVEVHANQDGVPEWAFNDTGYGGFGHQTVFASGNSTETLAIVQTGRCHQPRVAAVLHTQRCHRFQHRTRCRIFAHLDRRLLRYRLHPQRRQRRPEQRQQRRLCLALSNRQRFIREHNDPVLYDGSGVRIVSYANGTGVSFSPWQTTCTNATRIIVADVNGDEFDDAVGYAPADDQLCIHFTNTSSGGFEPQVNVTHAASIIDLDFADITGNGLDEMVSIRSGGEIHVDEFSNRSNSFSNRDSEVVYVSGTNNKATLTHMMLEYFDGPQNNPTLMAGQSSGTANQAFWSTNTNSLAVSTSTIAGVVPGSVVGDFDGDQDLDIVAPRPTGHRSIENRGPLGWDGDDHNRLLTLTNATILDYDLDSAAHLLVPNAGNPTAILPPSGQYFGVRFLFLGEHTEPR